MSEDGIPGIVEGFIDSQLLNHFRWPTFSGQKLREKLL